MAWFGRSDYSGHRSCTEGVWLVVEVCKWPTNILRKQATFQSRHGSRDLHYDRMLWQKSRGAFIRNSELAVMCLAPMIVGSILSVCMGNNVNNICCEAWYEHTSVFSVHIDVCMYHLFILQHRRNSLLQSIFPWHFPLTQFLISRRSLHHAERSGSGIPCVCSLGLCSSSEMDTLSWHFNTNTTGRIYAHWSHPYRCPPLRLSS